MCETNEKEAMKDRPKMSVRIEIPPCKEVKCDNNINTFCFRLEGKTPCLKEERKKNEGALK